MSVTSTAVESDTERHQRANAATAKAPRVAIAGIWHWIVALVDQALVSGTRFLATIIVGRYCGPRELGTYSLAFSLLVLFGCFQEAIVTTPYAVLGQRLRRRSKAAYAGAVAKMHFAAAIGSIAVLIVLAIVGYVLNIHALPTIALVLAVTLPCSLAMEFVRRFSLAELNVQTAAWLDAGVAGLQILLLLLLAQIKWLDARVALLGVGVAYVAPALMWWAVVGRTHVRFSASPAKYWPRNWRLGRWLVASQVTSVIHGYMPAWLLAVLVGTNATGEFVAYLNLALLANPLIFAVGNLLTPRAAHALARGGPQATQRLVFRVLLYFVALMSVFALGLSVGGTTIMHLVYGKSFVGSEKVAGLLGLVAITWSVSATCGSGLIALGCPRWGFVASCTGSIVTALSIVLLAPRWAVYGATLGILLGSTTAAAIQCWAFIRFSGGLRLEKLSPSPGTFDPRLATQDLN
jgi:O-antigen/teichoic acid export membrane protein